MDLDPESNIESNRFLLTHPRPIRFTDIEPDGVRSVQEIPELYRSIFSDFQHFNAVQSTVFDDVLYSNRSLVVCAPTGSGKTVILELAIVRLLYDVEDNNITVDEVKIVYISPTKALCNEKLNEFRKKFHSLPFPFHCTSITGDNNLSIDLKEIENYQILITTPEKWDSMSRKWRDHPEIVNSIKLFLIDEVHLLSDCKRGPTLEAIVSRMKTIQTFSKSQNNIPLTIRFVAVSATIPNIDDLANWLGDKNNSAHSHRIFEDQRPVQLIKHVIGYEQKRLSNYRFDMSLNYQLSAIIGKYSIGKPILIFCSTRKGVEMAGDVLSKQLNINIDRSFLIQLNRIGEMVKEKKIKDLLRKGIAYHHAGIDFEDRKVIEQHFRDGAIPILLATNTLAFGVNFPAHLVIIKSTDTYVNGILQEISECALLQMIGRAGRPQYDNTGIVIIMTQMKNVRKYEKLVNSTVPIESHLHKCLAEHINSEIVLQSINDLSVAMEWIRTTFLYVRAFKNPINYGLSATINNREQGEKKLEEMCLIAINALEKYGLIDKDQVTGMFIQPTLSGRLMARYYLSFQTMKIITQIDGIESMEDILIKLSQCNEFSELPLRQSDKKCLNELNRCAGKETIRFPIKGRIKTISQKVLCLIQAGLGNLPITDSSLQQESIKIIQLAERIMHCMFDYVRYKTSSFKLIVTITILSKCFVGQLWENSIYLCKQFKKIGQTYSMIIAGKGFSTIDRLLQIDPREIEILLNKMPPFGNEIVTEIKKLPRYIFTVRWIETGRGEITVNQLNDNFSNDGNIKDASILIGDSKNHLLITWDNVQSRLSRNKNFQQSFKTTDPTIEFVKCYLIHQKFVGIDQEATLYLNDTDIIKSKSLTRLETVSKRSIQEIDIRDYLTDTSVTDTESSTSTSYIDDQPEPKPSTSKSSNIHNIDENRSITETIEELIQQKEPISLVSTSKCSSKFVYRKPMVKNEMKISGSSNQFDLNKIPSNISDIVNLNFKTPEPKLKLQPDPLPKNIINWEEDEIFGIPSTSHPSSSYRTPMNDLPTEGNPSSQLYGDTLEMNDVDYKKWLNGKLFPENPDAKNHPINRTLPFMNTDKEKKMFERIFNTTNVDYYITKRLRPFLTSKLNDEDAEVTEQGNEGDGSLNISFAPNSGPSLFDRPSQWSSHSQYTQETIRSLPLPDQSVFDDFHNDESTFNFGEHFPLNSENDVIGLFRRPDMNILDKIPQSPLDEKQMDMELDFI